MTTRAKTMLTLAVLLAHAYFGSYAASIGNYFCQGFAEALADAEGSGAEKLYITSDAMGRGAWQSSEIMTLFHDRTDALYFQGKTNVSGGKERSCASDHAVSRQFCSTDAACAICAGVKDAMRISVMTRRNRRSENPGTADQRYRLRASRASASSCSYRRRRSRRR